MFSVIVTAGFEPRLWSNCTIEELRKNFEEGNRDHCLKNKPITFEKRNVNSVCGNFFVEPGE